VVGTSASADLFVSNQLKSAPQQGVDRVGYGPAFCPKVHFDTHLMETLQGAHAYTAHDQSVSPILMEQPNRGKTPTMLMTGILNDGYVANITVVQFHQGEDVALSEMS